jgi:hypothetical protein
VVTVGWVETLALKLEATMSVVVPLEEAEPVGWFVWVDVGVVMFAEADARRCTAAA